MSAMRGRCGLLVLAAVVGACGESPLAAPPASRVTVAGVGELPEELTRSVEPPTTTNVPATTVTGSTVPRSTVTIERDVSLTIGGRVEGNRLIMIGDSILAATSRRYTGEMCLGLVPLHWAVEIDAERGRAIDFAPRVLKARLDPDAGLDWDVAAVFLGTNYGGDIAEYTRQLDITLEQLAPRPTLLYTVTEFKPDRADVNAAIRSMLAYYPNVQIIDWAGMTDADPSLLGDDGYHPSPAGISRLVLETARVLGAAPTGQGGDCLSSRFTNDSAGGATPVARPRAAPRPTTTRAAGQTTVPPRPTTTELTARPGQPTTAPPAQPAPTTALAPTSTTPTPTAPAPVTSQAATPVTVPITPPAPTSTAAASAPPTTVAPAPPPPPPT